MVRGVSRENSSVPTVAGAESLMVDGFPVVLHQLGLACCAVEAAGGVAALAAASAAEAMADPATERHDLPTLHVLLVAGTVTRALAPEVSTVWGNLPAPKVAVAFGACTISGGPYWDSYAVAPGLAGIVDAQVFVPGCPPAPAALVAGVQRAVREFAAGTAQQPRADIDGRTGKPGPETAAS